MGSVKQHEPATCLVPREIQDAWLQLIRAKWSSLALVPTAPTTSSRPILDTLAAMADFYELGEFKLVNAEGASLHDSAGLAHELTLAPSKHSRIVVAVDSPAQNGGALPLVTAADALVLLVRLGSSNLAAIHTIIQMVGRERILGAVALSGRKSYPRQAPDHGVHVISVGGAQSLP
jgi:hypothetical protein